MKSKQNDQEFFENVVLIGLGIWFATVSICGIVGVVLELIEG